MNLYKIIVADDHPVVRDSLKLFFGTQLKVQKVAEAANGNELLEKLSAESFDLAVIDIRMPELNGIDATKQALKIRPNLKVIVFSTYDDINLIHGAVEAGANGYLLKTADFSELELAVNWVMNNKTYYSAKVLEILSKNMKSAKSKNEYQLTDRETEVLKLICKGLSRPEIAEKLFISERTFDKHRENLLLKTNCNNSGSLILFALKNKIISIEEIE